MDQEFERRPGNTAISSYGFEVSVNGGSEITVVYKECDKQASIPAERTSTGGIGLFMDWARFPDGVSNEVRHSIFERVIRALWFLEIPIGWTELDKAEDQWPLPPRQT